MTLFAARMSDVALCPVHGVMMIAFGSPNVAANSKLLARATDVCVCTGGVASHVKKGSGTVLTNSLPTSHVGSVVDHGAVVGLGSPNVLVGGPDVSVSGPFQAGKAACKALAATRHTPGRSRQSYGNCSIESMRQMLNAQRAAQGLPPLSEDEALDIALQHGANADYNFMLRGGMPIRKQQKMMADENCPCDVTEDASQDDMVRALDAGYPVSTMVHSSYIWMQMHTDDCHQILVTGVLRDSDGTILGFYINDTGAGNCGKFVPAAQMAQARKWDGSGNYPIMVPKNNPF